VAEVEAIMQIIGILKSIMVYIDFVV